MSIEHKSRIFLVGAGPGDPDLITLKGVKALQSARVVLYDALVNPEILKHAPDFALRIYVGKRANNHHYPQEEINRMLVQFALTYGQVVRLKGGDPFVFGRGHEEMAYARSFGVDVEMIPGISSSTALAGLQGVPLTCRGINESFWVLTGTTRTGQLSKDVALAAQSSATAVILMGMRKLEIIMEVFAHHGKRDTPVMIIQNGSLPNERVVIGKVKDIVDQTRSAEIGSPGIIIIGDVVALKAEAVMKSVAATKVKQPV